MCAVANKVIEIVKDPKLLREVIKKEKKLVNGLKKMSLKYGSFKEIRSFGLWIGCDLRKAEEVKTLRLPNKRRRESPITRECP